MIYFDNAATTQPSKSVIEKISEVLNDNYGNPSGIYSLGLKAKREINDARHVIANMLGCFDKEILFTSGGSESDNTAIKSVARALKDKGCHIITSSVEHHAVLESCKELEKEGFKITYLPVDKSGRVSPDDLEKEIREDTILVSVMMVNNELGTIEPIEEIGKICKKNQVVFHTDAVQAFGKMPIDVNKLNIDLLSASAHKFHGPKGTGFLYVRSGTPVLPFVNGGEQEFGLRAGTENVPNIAGMAVAAKEADLAMQERKEYIEKLKRKAYELIIKNIPDTYVNGNLDNSVPEILNLNIKGIEGESLLINLDMRGVCASTGSACAMSSREPSHVLRAIGLADEDQRSSLRLSFSYLNTEEEVEKSVEAIKASVEYLRKLRRQNGDL